MSSEISAIERWTGRFFTRVYDHRPNKSPRTQTSRPESRISWPVNPRKSPWFRSGSLRLTSPPGRCSGAPAPWAASWAARTGSAVGATAPSSRSSSTLAAQARIIVSDLLGFTGMSGVSRGREGSVRADRAVRRLGHGVDFREKTLGQLVRLAFAGLVGLDRNPRVVAAFCLNRHDDASDRAGKLAAAGLLLARSQEPSQERSGARQHLVRRQVGA